MHLQTCNRLMGAYRNETFQSLRSEITSRFYPLPSRGRIDNSRAQSAMAQEMEKREEEENVSMARMVPVRRRR
jgi:hypothetical protein